MTLFLNFRTAGVGGDVVPEPYVLEGDGLVDPVALRTLGSTIPADRILGREVVFAVHGFNVSYAAGVHSLARLESDMSLGPHFVFVGVLWPGDYWLPVINYPSEASDAVRCGQLLAAFVNANLRLAANVSFVSHSLGGRLVLEAVKYMDRPAREVCLTAPAVDDTCLGRRQYDDARTNAQRTTVLASKGDLVLRLAYPPGDFLSDLALDDDDSPWRAALGYHGPRPAVLARVAPAQIAPGEHHGHGDYFPRSATGTVPAQTAKSERFISESLLGLPHGWP